jgi:hypothetical protein
MNRVQAVCAVRKGFLGKYTPNPLCRYRIAHPEININRKTGWIKPADGFQRRCRTHEVSIRSSGSRELIKAIFDLNFFNGRPLAALVRLTQTISGRPQRNRLRVSRGRPGRISFPLPFGQIKNHIVRLISFAKRCSLGSGHVGRKPCLRLSAANFS